MGRRRKYHHRALRQVSSRIIRTFDFVVADRQCRTLAVNTRGLWLCQKYEAQQMQKQEPASISFHPAPSFDIPGQRGAIANIASVSGLHGAGLAAYTPSKYAVIGITKNGAKFYGPSQIRINALCPG